MDLLEESLYRQLAGFRTRSFSAASWGPSPKTSRISVRSLSRVPSSTPRPRSSQLAERGEREERALRETLERHRDQVEAELARHQRDYTQLLLDFQGSDARQLREDTRQLDANIAALAQAARPASSRTWHANPPVCGSSTR